MKILTSVKRRPLQMKSHHFNLYFHFNLFPKKQFYATEKMCKILLKPGGTKIKQVTEAIKVNFYFKKVF